MKKLLAMLMVGCMLLGTLPALADNATIAVRGQNDFDTYISSMVVLGDKLLMANWDTLYTWDATTRQLQQVEGYDQLDSMLHDVVEVPEDGYLSYNGDLYAIDGKLYRSVQTSDGSDDIGVLLTEIVIGEDGSLSIGDIIDLGDALTIWESYDDDGEAYAYMRDMQNPCTVGQMMYALSWGDNGRELLQVDLESESVESMTLDFDGEVQSIAPYTEGKVLMVVMDYDTDPMETSLYVYDTEAEEATRLGILPQENYYTPSAIAYDAARSKIYYTLSGSVWRMDISEEGLGEAEEFGDMPLSVYDSDVGIVIGDLYVVSSSEGVIGRDVTTDKLPEEKLRVADGTYDDSIRNAYYGFTDQHPEYMVSISHDTSTDTLLQSMMNRDSSVDIYTLSGTESALQALLNRGYVAELEGSEIISTAVAEMYPYIQDFCMRDGHIYTLPISGYTDAMAINVNCLKKLGYTEEDIPTNWAEFLKLIADIADSGRLEEMPEITIADPYYTRTWYRESVFSNMMQDFFLWLDQSEDNVKRSSEVLIELCNAFDAVNWDGLGYPEELEDGMYDYNVENILLQEWSVGVDSFHYWMESVQLMPLAVVEGEDPLLGSHMDFAFVNPFSEHKEEAIQYLEEAWKYVSETDKMEFSPNKNEPIENEYYEENLKSIQNYLDEMKKQLEETTDEEVRESIQTSITSEEEWLEEYRTTRKYSASAEDIQQYRIYAEYIQVMKSNLWSNEDANTQMNQYLDGAMTAEQLANALEKTLQMQRLEGN